MTGDLFDFPEAGVNVAVEVISSDHRADAVLGPPHRADLPGSTGPEQMSCSRPRHRRQARLDGIQRSWSASLLILGAGDSTLADSRPIGRTEDLVPRLSAKVPSEEGADRRRSSEREADQVRLDACSARVTAESRCRCVLAVLRSELGGAKSRDLLHVTHASAAWERWLDPMNRRGACGAAFNR